MYYHQIQTQLGVTELFRCYFVVFNNGKVYSTVVEFDENFFKSLALKSEQFFRVCILPELIGKYYSRVPPLKKKSNTAKKSDVKDSEGVSK